MGDPRRTHARQRLGQDLGLTFASSAARGRQGALWIDEGVGQYAARLPPDSMLELAVVLPRRGQSDEERLLAAVRGKEIAVIFDRYGKPISSAGMAALLAEWRIALSPCWSAARKALAHSLAAGRSMCSLSAMTLPRQLVRTRVAEQICRAWTILVGHPCHQSG